MGIRSPRKIEGLSTDGAPLESRAVGGSDQQVGTMQSGQNCRGWKRFMLSLKEKWADLKNGIVFAIAEEEMRICREEITNHVGGDTLPVGSLEVAQSKDE